MNSKSNVTGTAAVINNAGSAIANSTTASATQQANELKEIQQLIEKLKTSIWYIPDVSGRFQIGQQISSQTSNQKETKIFECSRISSQGSGILSGAPASSEFVIKCIRRRLELPSLKELTKQLFQLQNLYEIIYASQHAHCFGDITGFDLQFAASGNNTNWIIIRLIIEKCTGTLAHYISTVNAAAAAPMANVGNIQNNILPKKSNLSRMSCEEYLHHIREMIAAMFFLESQNLSHKNLTIHNIYYINLAESSSSSSCSEFTTPNPKKPHERFPLTTAWKIFGFVDMLWGYSQATQQHYISPEEKYLMLGFAPVSYDIDYYKVDAFNLGVTFLEVLCLRELPNWEFPIDEQSTSNIDPKTKEESATQAKLNAMLSNYQQYFKNYPFLIEVLKSMVHVNPKKRDRFTRILTVLHSNLKLRLLCFQPAEDLGVSTQFNHHIDNIPNSLQNQNLAELTVQRTQSASATMNNSSLDVETNDYQFQHRKAIINQKQVVNQQQQQPVQQKADSQPINGVQVMPNLMRQDSKQNQQQQGVVTAPVQQPGQSPPLKPSVVPPQQPQPFKLFPTHNQHQINKPPQQQQQQQQQQTQQQQQQQQKQTQNNSTQKVENQFDLQNSNNGNPEFSTRAIIDMLDSVYPQQQQQPIQQQQQQQGNTLNPLKLTQQKSSPQNPTVQDKQSQQVVQRTNTRNDEEFEKQLPLQIELLTKKHAEQIASIRKLHALELEQVQQTFEKQISTIQSAHSSQLKDFEAITRETIQKLEQKLKLQQEIIDQSKKQIDAMSQEMGVMQSNIRFNTDNRLELELKRMKELELLKNNSTDNRPKPVRNAKENFKLAQMAKFDTETVRELKTTLGTFLSAFRPNAVNRAYLITWMATNSTYFKYQNMFKTAIKDASDSRNSDAIFIIISSLFASKIDQQKIFELVYQDGVLRNHFIRYLRIFKPNVIKTFSDYFLLSDIESGYILYRKAYANSNQECQLEFTRLAHRLASANRTGESQSIVIDSLNEQIDFMSKHNASVLDTVHEKLEGFYEKKELFKGNDYAKQIGLSQRTLVIKRFRALLLIKQIEEADTYIEANYIAGYDESAKCTLFHLDPELIANEFFKRNHLELTWKYMKKIEDTTFACERLAAMEQFDIAIEHAIDNKNITALEIIQRKTRDNDVKNSISTFIERLKAEGKPVSRNPLKRLFKF